MSVDDTPVVIVPGTVNGAVTAPPSKSYFQRATAAALLAAGETVLTAGGLCDDTRAALGAAVALGARVISHQEERLVIRGGLVPSGTPVHCGESGLALRMFAPIAALADQSVRLTAEGSLLKRPVSMLVAPLATLGARCETAGGFPPITVHGPLRGGEAVVDGSISSQGLTGLLMALPCAEKDSVLTVAGLTSRPYVAMTLDVLASFGITVLWEEGDRFIIPGGQRYRPGHYVVEGDWSSAAALLVAGAVAGTVTVQGLSIPSRQADSLVLEVLREAGARVECGQGKITITARPLRSFTVDLTDAPDLFPVLTALALTASGVSRLTGVSRLRHKESDRATVLQEEFSKMGAQIQIEGNDLVIPSLAVRPNNGTVTLDARGDHRIAMAVAIAALRFGPITIRGASAVAKSYPAFFEDLARLCQKDG